MKAAFTGLVFCVASLLALGLVVLYSANMSQPSARYFTTQLQWCALGLVACGMAARVDYDLLRKYAWPIWGLAVVLLALVLVPHLHLGGITNITKNGATRWLGYNKTPLFQPSEFAKLALIIVIAWYGAKCQAQMRKFWRGLVVPAVFIGVVLGLVIKEPDRGTTALLAAVAGAMLVVAGASWRFILPPMAVGVVGFIVYLCRDPMAWRRIDAWLHPELYKSGPGYQSYEALLALGSGGLTGLGLGNGRQKLGFLPFHRTDFIFSVIGEELGLIGTLGVLLAFVGLVVCGFYIAKHARDTFGSLLAFGITVLIGLQAAFNIAVVTGALPNKGLPLPFISAGGSSLLVMLTAIGIVLNVARLAPAEEEVPKAALDSGEIRTAEAN